MGERLSASKIAELIDEVARSDYGRDQAKSAAKTKLREAITAAYLEADEAVVLREQLDAQTRAKLVLEQEKRELLAQANLGGDLVVYAPMLFGARTEIDFDNIPRGHAIVLTDDPVLAPRVQRKAKAE